MAKIEDCPGFETFGSDVKAAREALNISRRASVLNADGVIEPQHSAGAAPKVAELPCLIQRGGVPNHMIMDMLFVDMGADNIGVFALGESLGKLTAQAVCFLRGDFTRDKGLAQMVGNYIILTAHSAGLLDVLIFGKKKFGIRDPAVTLPARNQSAVIRLLRIFGVVQYVADCLSYRAAFSGVQGHQACGCHRVFTSLKAKRPAEADRLIDFEFYENLLRMSLDFPIIELDF